MYSNVPGFVTVIVSDAPGAIAPVVQDPSRAAIVRAVDVVFLNTSGDPALIFTRGELRPSSLRHSSRRPAVATLKVWTMPS